MPKKRGIMENKFNLVDEKWIPLEGGREVSLKDIFDNKEKLPNLRGNPIQKISLIKFLLALVHSAYTPKDQKEWQDLGANGMAQKTLEYLESKKDLFYLYGEKPFLQMPEIKNAKKKNISILEPYIIPAPIKTEYIKATNATVLTEIQQEIKFKDSEKIRLVIQNLNFALGGKKADNSIVLTKGYSGKTKAAKGGPSGKSLLHCLVFSDNLIETLYFNLLTKDEILSLKTIEEIGTPPWEKMPKGEDDEIAKKLKKSYLGILIPLSRFILLTNNDLIHYTEGFYPLETDFTTTRINTSKGIEYITVNTNKKPWREITSFLSFIDSTMNKKYNSLHLKFSINKLKNINEYQKIKIYSGGLKLSPSNAGEEFITGNSDFVESEVELNLNWLGKEWFEKLKLKMKETNDISKELNTKVYNFYKEQKNQNPKELASKAENHFWQLVEKDFNKLLEICSLSNEEYEEESEKIRKKFIKYAFTCYDTFCPHDTARQIESWAKNSPIFKGGEKDGK